MLVSALLLIICYFLFRYTTAWIVYYNQTDKRMPKSIWRYTCDYPVIGTRDISDLDDKPLTALKSIMHQAKETSVYKCESNEVQQQTHEQTRKAVQNSVAFEVVDKKETDYVSKKTSQTTVDTLSSYQVNKQTSAIEDPPVASRPVSRQRRLVQVSRPNSRTGDSRPGSRKVSRP